MPACWRDFRAEAFSRTGPRPWPMGGRGRAAPRASRVPATALGACGPLAAGPRGAGYVAVTARVQRQVTGLFVAE
jgi:hypothetical protein